MDELIQSLGSAAKYEENVENQTIERNARKLRGFISTSGEAIGRWKKWEESVEGVRQAQKDAEDEEFIKMAVSMIKVDGELLAEARMLAKRYMDATGETFRNEILRIFKVAFKNTRARNILIYEPTKDEDGRTKVTIGPDGFGMRYNVQSKPVERFADVGYITQRKDEIIKGLKKNNMTEQAKMFKKFCDMIPEIDDKLSIVDIDIRPIVLPKGDLNEAKPPMIVAKMYFCGDAQLKFPMKQRWGDAFYELYYDGKERYTRGKYTSILQWDDALVYMQISPHMNEYVQRYKEKVNPSIEKSETAIDALRKEFGRQLLVEAI